MNILIRTTAAILLAATIVAAQAEGTYNAVCDGNHGVIKGWIGPDRSNREEAQADADRHAEETGHDTTVISF